LSVISEFNQLYQFLTSRFILIAVSKILRVLSILAIGAALLTGSDETAISIRRVFGPETPTGRYKHPASLTELQNGDLYLTWYGGGGEYEPGTAVYGSRFAKGKWTPPVKLAHDEFYSVGNPVIWQAPEGAV
jgi:hypothetical protein